MQRSFNYNPPTESCDKYSDDMFTLLCHLLLRPSALLLLRENVLRIPFAFAATSSVIRSEDKLNCFISSSSHSLSDTSYNGLFSSVVQQSCIKWGRLEYFNITML